MARGMKEKVFLVRREPSGWVVALSEKTIAGPFSAKESAIAAASRAAAEVRRYGYYAWIKLVGGDDAGLRSDESVPVPEQAPAPWRTPLAGFGKLFSR